MKDQFLLPLLTREQLSVVAFDILTSSGIERYTRMVQRAVIRTQLRDRLRGDMDLWRAVGGRALRLLAQLRLSADRDEPEVELAVLVAALATTGSKEIDVLLAMLARESQPSLVWIAALARQLLMRRAVTVDNVAAKGETLRVRVSTVGYCAVSVRGANTPGTAGEHCQDLVACQTLAA